MSDGILYRKVEVEVILNKIHRFAEQNLGICLHFYRLALGETHKFYCTQSNNVRLRGNEKHQCFDLLA